MRKIVSIFLLGIYLFSTTEVYQLLKLPVVFEHFHEHKLADRNISFLQFLVMHYGEDDPKDGDYQRDMKLPFKRTNHYITSISLVTVPESYEIFFPPKFHVTQNVFFIKNDSFVHTAFLSAIFQPPKTA
jgi:hypothetical protein